MNKFKENFQKMTTIEKLLFIVGILILLTAWVFFLFTGFRMYNSVAGLLLLAPNGFFLLLMGLRNIKSIIRKEKGAGIFLISIACFILVSISVVLILELFVF